jgi:hypothetical protein
MKRVKHFFHITNGIDAPEIVLEPRIPCSCDEPQIPRICVAPTIGQCCAAAPICKNREYSIYRTQKPQIGRSVYKVEDANITKERWLLKPTCFILIGKISGQIVEFVNKNQTNFHGDMEQIRGLSRIRKFLKEHRREILLDSYYGKFI